MFSMTTTQQKLNSVKAYMDEINLLVAIPWQIVQYVKKTKSTSTMMWNK